MQVCTGPYIPESGAHLHLSGAGEPEWKALERKKYASGQIKLIKTVYVGILEIWIGHRDNGFG